MKQNVIIFLTCYFYSLNKQKNEYALEYKALQEGINGGQWYKHLFCLLCGSLELSDLF